MSRRLPPLNALRVFEAAARHLSFTRAAAELHVTQAAVSHQVKALEDWVGQPLFRRLNRAIELTDAGARYLPALTAALDQIAEATARVAGDPGDRVLTISTLPSLAARWLVMRLARFEAAHPDLDVRVQSSAALVDFARQDVDLAIRYGRGSWPGLQCVRLVSETVFPVCSPELLRTGPPLRSPADLRHHTLIHDDFAIGWAEWLRAQGVEGVDPTRGPWFTDSALALQLAVEGRGVVLARSVIAGDDLAAGRLVRPFGNTAETEIGSYWLVAPTSHFRRAKVAAFRDWIMSEMGTAPNSAPRPLPSAGRPDQIS